MKKNLLFGLMFIMLVGAIFSATSDSATIQVSSYSLIPSVVYPDSMGSLQLTLGNAGTVTAKSVTIYCDHSPETQDYTTIGDIGPSSSTIASIPFKVPSNIQSGVLQIHLNIYYSYSDSTGDKTGNIKTTITIPVSQLPVLEVKTNSLSEVSAAPGDKFTAVLNVINTGGITKKVIIKSLANSSFSLEGTSQKSLGDIAFNSSKTVSVDLRSSSTIQPGKYSIPLTIEYQDAASSTVSQTVYVGPVSIMDSSAQFNIILEPLTGTEVGSEAVFSLIVKNMGSTASAAIVEINQSSVFTPIGSSRIYFDQLDAGETETRNITIGIDPSASGGYYVLPVSMMSGGNNYVQKVGIEVQATQEIIVTSKTDPTTVSAGSKNVNVYVQISNVGNTPIRSVYASVLPSDNFQSVGISDKFVGTLNVDDFTTFQFAVNVAGKLQPGEYEIPVKIIFKDSTNKQHIIDKGVKVTLPPFSDTQATPSATSTGFSGKKPGGILFGLGLFELILGLIVIAIIGYFGYTKYYKAKKGQAQ